MHLNPFSPCMQQPLWGCLLPCSEGTLSVQQPTMMNPINLTSTKVETWWKTLLLGLVLAEEWLQQWETKCKSFQQQEMGDNPNNNLGFLSPSTCTRGTYEASSSSRFFHVFITHGHNTNTLSARGQHNKPGTCSKPYTTLHSPQNAILCRNKLQ